MAAAVKNMKLMAGKRQNNNIPNLVRETAGDAS